MLLFFIYAALGVELFGRLGECSRAVAHTLDTGSLRRSITHEHTVRGRLRVLARLRPGPLLPSALHREVTMYLAHGEVLWQTHDVHTDTHMCSYPGQEDRAAHECGCMCPHAGVT